MQFSVIIPSTTVSGFTLYQQGKLCSALTAGWETVGAPINCTVGAANAFNGLNVLASGFAFFNWTTYPTAANLNQAQTLRDARVAALTSNATNVLGTALPGAIVNCACNGMDSVIISNTSPFTYNVNITGVPGPMQCGARLTYNPSVPSAINSQVGVDDGSQNSANFAKFCSTPVVQGGVLGVPGAGACRVYGVIGGGPENTTQAFVNTGLGVTVLNGNLRSVNLTGGNAGSGYTTVPLVTVSPPDPQGISATYFLDANARPSGLDTFTSTVITPLVNGPYKSLPVATIVGGLCVDVGSGDGVGAFCTGDVQTILDANLQARKGRLCRSEDFNSGLACGPATTRGACIFMAFTIVTNVFYPGTINTYCTSPPAVTFSNTLQDSVSASVTASLGAGGVIAALTVTGSGLGYRTPPTITIAPPTNANFGKLCSSNPIFLLPNGFSTAITAGITPTGECRPLGRNTVTNKVCSDPAVSGGETGSLNVFTCNVESSFIAQPGSTATSNCGVLAQSFTIPAPFNPTPTPTPSSTPSPTPTPTATPTPTPSKSCTYSGVYRLESAGCIGQYIAYNIGTAACKNTAILLRTVKQAAGQRTQWRLNAVATSDKIPLESSIAAVGRATCANPAVINLAASTNQPVLRLGSSLSKLRIKPVDFASCAVVTIQATSGSHSGKFLGFKPPCSNKADFLWASNASANNMKWNLKKIAS